MPKEAERKSFTLRFEDEATHAALKLVAEQLGLSMNRLAEELIAQSLKAMALALQDRLSETVEALRSYHGEGIDEDWSAFARAEVDQEDPIRGRRVPPIPTDRYGLTEIFARRVE